MCTMYRSVFAFLFAWLMALSVQAEEMFHISARIDDGVARDGVIARQITLNVLSLCGSDTLDAAVWIEGPNGVTFDSRKLPLGHLPAGQDKGFTFTLPVPGSLKTAAAQDDLVVWNLEFANSAGERELIRVSGSTVPSAPAVSDQGGAQ